MGSLVWPRYPGPGDRYAHVIRVRATIGSLGQVRDVKFLSGSTSYGQTTGPGHCTEQQLIAQRPSMLNEAREVLCQGRFPASLIYCAHCEPIARCPVDFLCRFPLVIFQQAAQSFSTPHCSRVPSCLQRKQDPIAFALMVPLLMVMQQILMQGSPQR